MASPQRIIVGIDGSLAARIALDWAVAEARAHGRTVHVVNAWSAGAATDFAWLPAGQVRTQSEALLTEALRDTDTAGVDITWAAVEGDPASVLLVLASHQGLSVLGRPPGSVTSSCMRDATVPVVVVPAAYANGDSHEPGHSHGWTDEALPRPSGADQPRP